MLHLPQNRDGVGPRTTGQRAVPGPPHDTSRPRLLPPPPSTLGRALLPFPAPLRPRRGPAEPARALGVRGDGGGAATSRARRLPPKGTARPGPGHTARPGPALPRGRRSRSPLRAGPAGPERGRSGSHLRGSGRGCGGSAGSAHLAVSPRVLRAHWLPPCAARGTLGQHPRSPLAETRTAPPTSIRDSATRREGGVSTRIVIGWLFSLPAC